MTEHEIMVRRLEILVEQYVTARKKRHDYVSTSAAVTAIEQIIPTLPIAYRNFDDMIAKAAIAHGLAVSFDRPGDTRPVPQFTPVLRSHFVGRYKRVSDEQVTPHSNGEVPA